VLALDKHLRDSFGTVDRAELMRGIEARLRPCLCGGHFRDAAARRCHVCRAEVIVDGSGWDLWPGFFGSGDETEELERQVQQFTDEHIRRTDVWLEP
jgi:hypothetical protein